jgi:hypothetical protein
MVELESDEMVRNADKVDVAFLVVGDPLGWVYVCLRIVQKLISQSYHPHGSATTVLAAQYPYHHDSQRFYPDRTRINRTTNVQFRSDTFARILYRNVDTSELV